MSSKKGRPQHAGRTQQSGRRETPAAAPAPPRRRLVHIVLWLAICGGGGYLLVTRLMPPDQDTETGLSAQSPAVRNAVLPALQIANRPDGVSVGTFDHATLSAFLTKHGLPAPKQAIPPMEAATAGRLHEVMRAVDEVSTADNLGILGQLFDFLLLSDLAQACYEQAIKINPQDYRLQHLLGRLHSLRGETAKAEKYLRRAIQLRPDYPSSHLLLARVLLQLDRVDEAEAILRENLRAIGTQAFCWNELARIALQRNNAHEAVRAGQEALKLEPGEARTHALLSRAYTMLGDSQRAAEHARQGRGATKAMELVPVPDPLANEILRASDSSIFYRSMAMSQLAQRDWHGMVTSLEQAVQRDPANTDDQAMLAQALMEAGRPQDATRVAEAAIAQQPTAGRFYGIRAELAMRQQDWDGAIRWATDALNRDSTLPIAYMVRATALGATGRRTEAIPDAQRATELRPDNPEYFMTLGAILRDAGRYAEAATAIERTLELAPNAPGARERLAELRSTLSRPISATQPNRPSQ